MTRSPWWQIQPLDPGTISDNEGRRTYTHALREAADGAVAGRLLRQADATRFGDGRERHTAAYTYLAVAAALSGSVRPTTETVLPPAATVYHFAGHALREIGQLARAGDAYFRAGVAEFSAGRVPGAAEHDLGARSFARAKACFADAGDVQRSDEMHWCEWEARRTAAQGRAPLLLAWRALSGYGTSFGRWAGWLAGTLVVFTAAYQALHQAHLLSQQPGAHWYPVTPVYFVMVTTATVGYGDIVPKGWLAQSVVTINIVTAYALLAVGATILGRKVLGR